MFFLYLVFNINLFPTTLIVDVSISMFLSSIKIINSDQCISVHLLALDVMNLLLFYLYVLNREEV